MAADSMGISTTNEEFAKLLDEISSDEESDDDNDDIYHTSGKDDNDASNMDMTLDVVEVFKEKTIEDIIEEQREKLAKEGKVGYVYYINIFRNDTICLLCMKVSKLVNIFMLTLHSSYVLFIQKYV